MKRKVNIIVEDPKAPGGFWKTWAKKVNVGPRRNIHGSYWEALLNCAPDVENKINTLAVDLAECQLDNIKEATDYLVKKFTKAVEDMEFDQKMGAKITIRLISHEPKKRPA